MHILLTNDDGILAPGLAALRKQLVSIGEVTVAAPDTVQSATGHAITIRDPLRVRKVHAHGEFHGWAVAGRPADCVKLAVCELLQDRPDLVVSGLNDGANVSINVLYSGTVAAAAEGAILGIPSVAVSLEWGDEMDFDRAARIASQIIGCYADELEAGAPPCPLLNVNIPDLTEGRPVGIKVAPQAVLRSDDRYDHNDGPDGLRQYWLRGWFSDYGEPDFDLRCLRDGYVVLTPLHFDMTDHASIPAVSACSWPDVAKI